MAMFMTKVWGFHGPSTPLQFNTDGWRANARELLQRAPGAVVLLVATTTTWALLGWMATGTAVCSAGSGRAA